MRHPSGRTLSALHDGELAAVTTPARAARVEAHVASCDRCGARLAEFAGVGALVRGEVVPTRVPAPGWRPAPVWGRLAPALVAAAVVLAGFVISRPPDQPDQVAAGTPAAVASVPLPDVVENPTPEAPSAPSQPASPSSPRPGAPPRGDGAATPTTQAPMAGASAPTKPAAPIVVGLLVPGGDSGPGQPVVRSVAAALGQANTAGGINGAKLELLVGDASDPGAPAELVDRGARLLVGGFGVPAPVWQSLDAHRVPWFGPADVGPGNTTSTIAVEVPHASAGKVLAARVKADGQQRIAAIVGTAPERALADGLEHGIQVDRIPLGPGGSCTQAVQSAAWQGATVLALALEPASARTCLAALRADYPIRRILIPSTTVDDALAAVPAGFGLTAVLGAPGPDDPGPGVDRFRSATGVQRHYRSLVSFAAAELAVASLRRDAGDPLRGFATGGVYRSDLLTLNPETAPPNVATEIVDLTKAQAPGGGGSEQNPPGAGSQRS